MKNNVLKKLMAILVLILILTMLSSVGVFALAETVEQEDDYDNWTYDDYYRLFYSRVGDDYNEDEETSSRAFEWVFGYFKDRTSVRTPNGSAVEVFKYKWKDLSDKAKENLHNVVLNNYPNAIRLAPATKIYNCHSYAWYNQNSSENQFWIDYPYMYYDASDKSYERVYQPRVGDIVSYFNMNAPADEQNIHSGIIVQILQGESNGVCGDANLIMVESKWGSYALYRHRGDECPYAVDATEIRYYRPRTNNIYNFTKNMSDINKSVYLSGNGIENKYAMYELNVISTNDYTFNISADNVLDVRLYDKHMNVIYSSSDSNTVSLKKNLHTAQGLYYLRLAFKDTNKAGDISLKVSCPHIHEYSYKRIDGQYHYATCKLCLSKEKKPHAVDAGNPTNPLKPKYCMFCGATVEYAIVLSDTFDTVKKFSDNGSYVLPNGVIVLVSEDVSSYLNGTLVFNEVTLMSTIQYQYSTIGRLSQMQ